MSIDDATTADTLLLFADISGYTDYLRSNPYAAAHALLNVQALLESILAVLEPAFALAKLEGDAAFMHADVSAFNDGTSLPALLQGALGAFDTEKARLLGSNVCGCRACLSLSQLDLKFILHAGPVLHYRTRGAVELGGLPVIVLHRLGKNSVQSSRYVLWTLPLTPQLQALQPATRRVEAVQGIGATDVLVHETARGTVTPIKAGALAKLRDLWRKEWPWWVLRLRGVRGKDAAFDRGEESGRH